MPIVSVIVPTYNRAAFVMEAVDSVLRQSLTDLELIVVVDGSEDDTLARLSSIGDPRLTVLHQENAGLNAARNAALARCTGEFIALLDDDDVWLENKLALQVRLMGAHPDAAYAFSEFYAWRPGHSEILGGLRRWFSNGWFELDETGQQMLAAPPATDAEWALSNAWKGDLYHSLMVGALILPSSAIFRASMIPRQREIFPEDDFYCGDWAFFADLSRTHPALFLDFPTTRNRSHHQPGRLTQAAASVRLEKEAAMLERVWGTDQAFMACHGDRYRNRLRDVLVQLSKAYLRAGQSDAARHAMLRCRQLPGRQSRNQILLGGVLAVPGLDRAVRLLDSTRSRWRVRRAAPA